MPEINPCQHAVFVGSFANHSCSVPFLHKAAAGCLMDTSHDPSFSTACNLHNPLQLHLRLALLALCKLLVSGADAHYTQLCQTP